MTVERRRQVLLDAARAYARAWDRFQADDTEDNETTLALLETRLYQLAGIAEPAGKDDDA